MASSFPVQSQVALNLAMGANWKPYVYIDEHGQRAGEDLLLLNRVLDRLGYQLNTENLPEQRMALEIQQGQVDVVLGAAYTKAREAQNFFSVPYRKEIIVLGYRHSLHPEIRDMDINTLLAQDGLVAVNKSGWFGAAFKQDTLAHYDSNLVHAEGTHRRMQLLDMDRVDAVVGDSKVLQAAADEMGIDDFVIAEKIIHETAVHFMFSRARVDAAFMQRFNTALLAEQSKLRQE
ncbi:hypothetical protein BFC17_06895 [Alteromonas lipolytica]|uniref:Solute-binding protein family 3/N-terminal domain-containing protein n=2 Tax=Alteromonas lipolytica TaxID=1856405 RepID=A0A1E8F942_9ALTE|nr:hypothetical protein BFC17_06895 [Alteromonas lipolytica]